MLREFVQGKPDDPFPRYGLAMEFKNQGQLADANREFAPIVARFPDYTPAYLHAGNVLESRSGERLRGAAVWKTGIAACTRKGDHHAQGGDRGGARRAGGEPMTQREKRDMKKIVGFVVAAGFAATLLGACGGGSKEEKGKEKPGTMPASSAGSSSAAMAPMPHPCRFRLLAFG